MWLREYVLVHGGKTWRIGYEVLTGNLVYALEV